MRCAWPGQTIVSGIYQVNRVINQQDLTGMACSLRTENRHTTYQTRTTSYVSQFISQTRSFSHLAGRLLK